MMDSSKPSLCSLMLSFGPKSEVVQFLKNDDRSQLPWKHTGDNLVLKFDLDLNAPYKPMTATYIDRLIRSRSPSLAEGILSGLSFALRHDMKIPEQYMHLLADALDRVRESGTSVKFLYGPQKRAGKPEKDITNNFYIFQMVESIYTTFGRLETSRLGEGAYDFAQEILRSEGIYLEISELRRIRQQILANANKDIEYMLQLVRYLEHEGFKVKQVL